MPSLPLSTDRAGSFVLICPPKSLEIAEGGRVQRALHSLELQAALHDIDFGGRSREYVILVGGGLVVEAPLPPGDGSPQSGGPSGPSAAHFADTMAAFVGTLTNYGSYFDVPLSCACPVCGSICNGARQHL